MMKNYILAWLFCIGTVLSLHGQDYKAILSGNLEPYPVLSQANGSVSLTLTADTLTVDGTFEGISSGVDTSIAGGAHIHTGIAGRNGGVTFALKPTLSDGLGEGAFEVASNTFILDEDMKSALNERRMYINVHSIDHGGGEIRGQILPNADEYYSTNLFGSNATISTMTDAIGTVVLELTGNTVTVSGSFSNLSTALATSVAGGIHIHEGMAGRNGSILQGLVVDLSEDSLSATIPAAQNTFDVTDEQLSTLRAGGWYVNVHSLRFGSGEIRGQLTPMADAKFRVNLSGMNQSPPVTSYGMGKLTLWLNGNTLTASGSFTGLESDLNEALAGGAHIHLGMAGRNGGVLFPLSLTVADDLRSAIIDPASNSFNVSGDTLMALMGRALYVNVHSLENGSGELRGQILPESQYFLNAYVSASQQSAAVVSVGDGAVVLEVLGNVATASGTFQNLSSPLAINVAGGAHIHFAPAGSNGPIGFPLVTTPDSDTNAGRFRAVDNSFDITSTLRDSLKARLGYVNVHSDNFGSGEIRGQLLHEAVAYFYTPLSGAEQPTAVNTSAKGAVTMEYTGSAAIFSGSFSGLSSALATQTRGGTHLHLGIAGSTGSIWTDLVVTASDSSAAIYRPGDNIYAVSSGWVDTVRNRMTYVNVHSENYGGGEIRGQLRPLVQNLYVANLRGKNSATPLESTGRGILLLEQNGTSFTSSGSFNNLQGDFATAIAGGAHIHLGMPGMTGGILYGLNSEVGEDLKSAIFLADSNQVVMPDSLMAQISGGNTYVNIHSTEVTSGEIRGQVLPEINFAPAATSFTAPSSGDTIIIAGDLTMNFSAEWEPSQDPNGNKVVYIWQLSTVSDFSTPVMTINTQESTSFETTFGAVDTLLGVLGIDSGEVVTVYHRVVASDGSLCSQAAVDSVFLVKGISTAVRENPFFDNLFNLYPSPAQSEISMEISLKQDANSRVYILDQTGKILQQERIFLQTGSNLITTDVSALQPGNYIMQLVF
ncbi:MAG: CHRD domain-containing protein, partial [Saprospiraceae bacterium]|nr:CHRD domain-containing protein [Saprospiraceae bacterium]